MNDDLFAVDASLIPNETDMQKIITTFNSTGLLPLFDSSGSSQQMPDTIFEHLGDILALELIKPAQYFRLKAMLHSSDFEVAKMARELILKNLQNV